jgi:hypothetical protein
MQIVPLAKQPQQLASPVTLEKQFQARSVSVNNQPTTTANIVFLVGKIVPLVRPLQESAQPA